MKTNELNIEPIEGRSLPVETNPRSHITAATKVPNTSYYRRAIKRGDVKLTDDAKSVKGKK